MPLFLPLFPLTCALDLIHISPFRDCSFFISFFFFLIIIILMIIILGFFFIKEFLSIL